MVNGKVELTKKENDYIVKAFIEIAMYGNCTWTRGLLDQPDFDRDEFRELFTAITRKSVFDL